MKHFSNILILSAGLYMGAWGCQWFRQYTPTTQPSQVSPTPTIVPAVTTPTPTPTPILVTVPRDPEPNLEYPTLRFRAKAIIEVSNITGVGDYFVTYTIDNPKYELSTSSTEISGAGIYELEVYFNPKPGVVIEPDATMQVTCIKKSTEKTPL